MKTVSRHVGIGRRPALSLLLLSCLLLAATAAFGGRVSLDEVVVPVPDRSPEAREAAVAQGLEILLVRLTGVRDVARYAGMEGLLAQPARYLQQYAYETADGPQDGGRLWLRMRFDREGIERVLRRHGLPLWGGDRPPLVAWIAIDDGRRRYLLADHPANPLVRRLRRTAERRGLPLLLPLMDLEDARAVRLADVWGGFVERLLPASRRYDEHPAVLSGRVRRAAGGGWRGRWKLDLDGWSVEWRAAAERLEALLAAALEEAADRLALRLAVRATGAGDRIPVTVEGVTDLAGHLAVRRRLQALAPVRGVHLRTLAPDQVVFELEVEGGEAALRRALAFDSTFETLAETPMLRLRAASLQRAP